MNTMNCCVGVLATGIAGVALAVVPSAEEASDRGVTYVMGGGGLLGYGCGFADLDADGDPDIVIVGAADGRVGIYENDGSGYFADRSLTSGIPLLTNASALAMADYDDDGLVDLYLTQWAGAGNVLVHNDGGFTFSNVSVFAGVNDGGFGKGACWGDYDGDGWLDLYVCNYSGNNRLYRNLGNGTFASEGSTQGVDDPNLGFQAVWFDYDRDGDVDLYLSNDKGYNQLKWGPNQLWRNDDGNLVNASSGSGADIALDSMGVGCGDFDGNRWPDLYMTNIPGGGGMNNPLLLNQDGASFTENGFLWGVDNPWVSWGASFYDFDNNGFLDLYVNNTVDPNTLYLNSGGPACLEVGAGAAVIGNGGNSYSSAVGDVDGDGDLDLLLNNLVSPVALYINHEGDLRKSIRYRVVGVSHNSGAVGACVDTRIGTSWKMRELLAGGNSYLGQNELLVHVGVGSATTADEVVVSWPGGAPTRTLTNLPTDATWTLYPPARLGDPDDDGDVDLDDFHAFAACHGLPFAPGCEIMDLDGDADVDDDDFDAFLLIYGPPLADCNDNSTVDLEEILLDPGLDVNGDGVIDACCPADLSLDGDVGFGDILAVIGAWGPCAACPEDLDGSGDVGFGDILAIIGAWGGCGS